MRLYVFLIAPVYTDSTGVHECNFPYWIYGLFFLLLRPDYSGVNASLQVDSFLL